MALVGNAVRSRSRRALTLVEVLIVLFGLALVLAVLLPAMGGNHHHGGSARQIKCATQVRNVIQAMTIFTNSNRDTYPLPSLCDANNDTVPEVGRAKDTTNNILSILVFNSSISPELIVSPSESNAAIKIHAGYQNSNPAAAVQPEKAVWDPSLRADFTTGDGHISYAALMPDGQPGESTDKAAGRLKHWGNTFNATEAVFGNRGPLVTGRDKHGDPVYDKKSLTMLIHGGRSTWEGNIGYNDNHVNFETRMNPEEITYRSADGKQKADILFYDEPDDAAGLNAYLGIWVKAGTLPSEFKGIHD